MVNFIITGGQTGVDQAAWQAALKANIPTGGWMPAGFMTEDGPRPEFGSLYHAREHPSTNVDDRTFANACDSDGTLVLISPNPGPGTSRTIDVCDELNRPCLTLSLEELSDDAVVEQTSRWIEQNSIQVLNIAGDRESVTPGVATLTASFFARLFKHLRTSLHHRAGQSA